MVRATTESERLVAEYLSVWNEREFSRLSNVVSDSFTLRSPTADDVRGRENVEAHARSLVGGFSDFRITTHEMLSREALVMTESTLSGTHDGAFMGVPPTYESFEVRGMATFVVEDGMLQEERSYFDRRALLGQLGLVDVNPIVRWIRVLARRL